MNEMIYKDAKSIADNLVVRLKDECDIINIAGSIRREKDDVKDIEIVCLPNTETVLIDPADMFSESTSQVKNTIGFERAVDSLHGETIKGNPQGRYMQIEFKQLIKLDLFMPLAHDYYRQFAIRTGSWEYSIKIASAWKKLGWVGTPDGLRLQKECTQIGVNKYKCICHEPTLPIRWTSEEHFFEWLGMKWIEPKFRY